MPEEAGMKLLRFLERRLRETVPQSLLHKWIRTGQVRVNKARAKPFALVAAGDAVRLPPFALARDIGETAAGSPAPESGDRSRQAMLGEDLPILAETAAVLVLGKPAGLACQPGSGQLESVAGRLSRAFEGSAYVPAPAHRLDRRTSGLLLAAKTHAAQKALHELFRTGGVRKVYLAWVGGDWPHTAPCLLEDRLEMRQGAGGREFMAATPGGKASALPLGEPPEPVCAARALSLVLPVENRPGKDSGLKDAGGATLLLLGLLTGRKHQIRAQLASRGFPVIGDGRYKGPSFSQLLLHAYALRLPEDPGGTGPPFQEFSILPDWSAPFLPDAASLAAARAKLERALDSLPELFRA